MLALFRRPKLVARFAPTRAMTDEFAREMSVGGHLTIANEGSDASVEDVEVMVIAGFRRIPLVVPAQWQGFRVPGEGEKSGEVSWSLTLDAPLRAEAGELWLSLRDQKRRRWEWRLPFSFERR